MRGLELRNIRVDGRRTSIKLEPELWAACEWLCRARRLTLDELCAEVAKARASGVGAARSFTSAFRAHLTDMMLSQLKEGAPPLAARRGPAQRASSSAMTSGA